MFSSIALTTPHLTLCHFEASSFNEHLLHTVSLSCLGGNYLHLNPKINYTPINWQFTHWGNAYTRYNTIPCQKMDGTSSVCQTMLIPLLSLKVRLPNGCQRSSTQNLLDIACWSQVCSQELQSFLTIGWMTQGNKHWNKLSKKTITYKSSFFLWHFLQRTEDSCVTAAGTYLSFFLIVITSGQQNEVMVVTVVSVFKNKISPIV